MSDGARNTQGRVTAVTVVSPLRGLWACWLRMTWPAADRFAPVSRVVKAPLLALSFINFAHWGLVWRMPPAAPRRSSRRLPHPYLLFMSNFNDDVTAYIDAFSYVVPWRMRAMWQGAYGFPGPRPTSRFERYIESKWIPTSHYYCAYSDASARIVLSARRVREEVAALTREAQGLDPDAFAAAYARMLSEVQRDL
jgi:hypothetical protein